MSLHEQSVGKTNEWYTPAYVFAAKGVIYDEDVASPGQHVTPWIPAKRFITSHSLAQTWSGFIWMNSPFEGRNGLIPWLQKFFHHGNGVALIPDRTSAPWWQIYAPQADLVLFATPKIKFIGGLEAERLGLVEKAGEPGRSPAQGTCLLAAGEKGRQALLNAAAAGLGVLFAPKLLETASPLSPADEA